MTHPSAGVQRGVEIDGYHGHPNYLVVYVVLVVFLGLSLLAAELGNKTLALSLIFGMAAIKAWLVGMYFMHLKWEPKMLWAFLGFGAFAALAFYLGVYPDIVWVPWHPLK